MKKRLLIANRSEIAIRIIRSAHKLGMLAVVFQSDKEPDALYLKYADEIIPARDATTEKPIFLDAERIVNLALEHNCLLYTSDAADDLLCVDLGGRRIIKK